MKKYLENVKSCRPIIHSITNYVTANDCANILLACGASPIMADDKREVKEIISVSDGLNLNIGTPDGKTLETMLIAGKTANKMRHPVVFDPVGAGISVLRKHISANLLSEVGISVICGNISEIKTLSGFSATAYGVDAGFSDIITEENLDDTIASTKSFAKKTNSVVAVTGAIDVVCNSDKAYIVRNGHPIMSEVTGTGCMLFALIAAFVTANPHDILEASDCG